MKADAIIKYLSIVGYADALNMTLITTSQVKPAKTKSGIDKEPRRLIMRLLEGKLIMPIPNRYGIVKHSPQRFYQLTKKAFDVLELKRKHITYKSGNLAEHNHQLINVLTAFYKFYPDWEIEISYPSFKNYKPDALVIMRKDKYVVSLLVEMETGTWRVESGFIKERVPKMCSLDFKSMGLANVKFLIVKSEPFFNPYWLPIEPLKDEDKLKERFFKYVKSFKVSDRWIFMPYYKYPHLDEKPFYNSKGFKVNL